MSQPSIDNPFSEPEPDVYAEGEVSPSEAEDVITTLTKGSVDVDYDGPRSLEDGIYAEPQEAADFLNKALLTPGQRFRSEYEEDLKELGFGESSVQELLESHWKKLSDTPVHLMAASSEYGEGSVYAVVVDDLRNAPPAWFSEEDEANLTFRGTLEGKPSNQEDIQDYARTVGGDWGDAYQIIADL